MCVCSLAAAAAACTAVLIFLAALHCGECEGTCPPPDASASCALHFSVTALEPCVILRQQQQWQQRTCCAVAGACVAAAAAAGVCCPHTNISVEVSDVLDQRNPIEVSLMGWMQRRVYIPSRLQFTADFLTGPPCTPKQSMSVTHPFLSQSTPSLPALS